MDINKNNVSKLNGDIFPIHKIRKAVFIVKDKWNDLLLQVLALIRWEFPLDNIVIMFDEEYKNGQIFNFLEKLMLRRRKCILLNIEKCSFSETLDSIKVENIEKEISLYISILHENHFDINNELEKFDKNYNIFLYHTSNNVEFDKVNASFYHFTISTLFDVEHDLIGELHYLYKLEEEWSEDYFVILNKLSKNRRIKTENLTDVFISTLFEKSISTPLIAVDVNNIMTDINREGKNTVDISTNQKKNIIPQAWLGARFILLLVICIIIISTVIYLPFLQQKMSKSFSSTEIGNNSVFNTKV